jgi:hypothetical protein
MICFRLRHQLWTEVRSIFCVDESLWRKATNGTFRTLSNAIDESGDVGYNVAGLKCPCPSGGGDGKDAGV